MTIGCEPCTCTGMLDTETFRIKVINLLCSIREQTAGGASTVLVMADKQPDGTIIKFLRNYLKDFRGVVIGYQDYELDGTTWYTPTGTVDVFTADVILLES